MKRYFKIYNILLALGISTSLVSCVKEDGVFKEGGSDGVIELAELPSRTSATNYITVTKAFPSQAEVEVPITLNYTGVNGPSQDVTVNWDFDDAAVTAANASNTVLPANLYASQPSKSVVIPAGQKKGTIILKVKTSSFDFSKNYAVGIKLKSSSAGVVSTNYGLGIFVIKAKNQWDGIYSVEGGYIQRYTTPTVPLNDNLTGSMVGNPNVTLATIDPTTVEIVGMQWGAKGGAVGGIEKLLLKIDPATNNVTMSSTVATTTLANMAGKVNKYDPATKTFTLNFDWNQASTKREVTDFRIKYSASR